MIHFNRFFLNTLLGMGGLIDVAGMANPKLAREEPNRFGSTLGHYDVGYGPYVMLPGYGSFTLRDEGGDFADTLYPMLSYLTFWMSAGKWVVEGSKPAPSCWIPMVCCATLPILTSWCAKLTFQRHDFIANGGSLKPEENPNAKAIQGELDDIDSQ